MATKQINIDNVGIIQTQNKEQVKKLYFQDNNKELIYWYRSNARLFISSDTIKKIGVDLTLDSHSANVDIELYIKDFFTQEETTNNIKETIKYSTSEYSYNNKNYRKLDDIALFTGNIYRFTPIMKNNNDSSQFVVLNAINLGNENYKVNILDDFQMTMGVIRNTIVSDATNPNINIYFEEANLTEETYQLDIQTDTAFGYDNDGYNIYVGLGSVDIGKYRKNVSLKVDEYEEKSSINYNVNTGKATIRIFSRQQYFTPRAKIIYNSYGNK